MSTGSPLGWGFVGTGAIATTMAEDLTRVPGNVLRGVASRSRDRAQAFAARHDAPAARAYDDVAELAHDRSVDVVYIATPHPAHAAAARTCLEAGTAVLCEKPLTMRAEEARELVALARDRGVFFAEGMWMRCNPLIRRAVDWTREGRCGSVGHLAATLGFVLDRRSRRVWDPELGASALLDLGVYPLALAHLVLGRPTSITATGVFDGAVDVSGGATLTYASGAVATLAWSQTAWCDSRASISGDGGRIEIGPTLHHPPWIDYAYGDTTTRHHEDVPGHGFGPQIAEVARCLRAGRTESDLLPHEATLAVMDDLDAIGSLLGRTRAESASSD